MDRASQFTWFPPVDLRALVWSAAATSPFYFWYFADALTEEALWDKSVLVIFIDQIQLAIYLILAAFGNVFAALGGAHFLIRNDARFRPTSFIVKSLVIAGLMSALSAAMTGFHLAATEASTTAFVPDDAIFQIQYSIAQGVLYCTSMLAAACVGSRLYVEWRQPSPDPKDKLRVLALCCIGLFIASINFAWQILDSLSLPGGLIFWDSLPVTLLSWLQNIVICTIDGFGISLLIGSIVIVFLHRAGVEENLGWASAVTLAGSLACLVFKYSPWLWDAPQVAPGTLRYQPLLQDSITAVATGVTGGPIYLSIVNRIAFRDATARFPQAIKRLQHWPNRPPE